ncbi:MAG TPA: formylmethanofuran dehydrogenase subunit A, partial [Dongiaceae bacterium]|nr:formylmethanofuran dehydrogenase subunit A [Dongiaceae bacterium]
MSGHGSSTGAPLHGTVRIRGGSIVDPRHGRRGEVGEILIADGRVVETLPAGAPSFDAKGLVVMPGGVDLHTHVAGPAIRAARLLCPRGRHAACLPSIDETGRRYARLGYTTLFDAAIASSGARAAHEELDQLPILDKGIFVLAGAHAAAIKAARAGDPPRLAAILAALVEGARAHAIKIVDPGGVAAWREASADDADPAPLLRTFAEAAATLRLPHPLHVHLPGLGRPGNAALTLRCLEALAGTPAHLTHLQFHAYGGRTPRGLRSRAPEIAAWINAHPGPTIDVGQVVFGPAVTVSADAPAQSRLAQATRARRLSLDIESETGLGIVPHDYRAGSLTAAVQWAAGLELMLLVRDPWRLALTTDHPNGGPFFAYPLIIRMLMDRAHREAILAGAHPRAGARTHLAGIAREYTLEEIAIVTRAAPARILGLA